MSSRADAFSGGAVVIERIGTVSREDVAPVVNRAKSLTSLEGQAVAAVIPGSAASGNCDASLLIGTPGEVGRAEALKGLTIVAGGAISWNSVASVGQRAPGSSGSESDAGSAIVVSQAAAGDSNASVGSGAPRLASRTGALTGLTVVSRGSGAKSGNVVASVGDTAPVGSSLEGQAVSAAIIASAARRNKDASILRGTPFVASLANTFASNAVVIVGTSSGNIVASTGGGAQGSSGPVGQASTTAVRGGTARQGGDASALSGAPGLTRRA